MVGKTFLHYKIIKKLGEGGMGVVYLAEDMKLERQVAIKFLPQHIANNSDERKRFQIEAKAAAALNHPNIATIFNIEEAENELFIVMEYIDGRELQDLIASGPLTLDQCLTIASRIAQGLETAHAKGIVHRDIKSSNIMLKNDGQVKIMDFGLAKVRGQKQITKAGTTLGTASYMSPEQTTGNEVDPRSDIWSLGVLLYEMITGQLPFKGGYEQATTYSILHEQQQPITGLRTGIPVELEMIVDKCLQKDPSDRYQHADELIVDLRQIKKESEKKEVLSQSGLKKSVVQKRKFSLKLLIAPVIVVLLLSAGYYFLGREAGSTVRIPVAVADFVNKTNEPELNGLSGILITALEQSNRLAVVTRSRMFDILKHLGKAETESIDDKLGIEICKKANINALVIASIQKLGNRYAIDLKVLDPLKDEYLFTAKEEGDGQESVFSMIDRLAEKTRTGLKEKTEQIEAARQNVSEIITANLDAYQHYFRGEELINKLKFKEAGDEFRKAVAIDSSFALAYSRLAYTMVWYGEERAKEPIKKAMLNIHNVPEKERFHIQAMNALIENRMDEALVIYKNMLSSYPDEKEALYQIGDWSYHIADHTTAINYLDKVLNIDPVFERAYQHIIWTYWSVRDYDKALDYAQQYVSRVPSIGAYTMLGEAYNSKSDFSTALKTYSRALEIFPDNAMIIKGIGETYIFKDDFDNAKAEFNKLIQLSFPLKDRMLGYQYLGVLHAYLGEFGESLKMMDQMIEINKKLDDKAALAGSYAEKAFWMIAGNKNRIEAEKEIDKGLRLAGLADEYFFNFLFWCQLMLGEYQEAQAIAEKHFISVNPTIEKETRAYVLRSKGENIEAIKNFQHVYKENGNPIQYKLAELYLDTGQYDEAVDAVYRFQTTYSAYDRFNLRPLQYPKSFYLLGIIYEKKGDSKGAKENYEKFLNLWKNADQDIPELIDAKSRLEKLRGSNV